MRSAAALAAVFTLLLAAPAAAKPDREGARAFAAATKQFKRDVLAQKSAIETGVLRLERDPLCDDAIRHVPIADGPFGAATALLLVYSIEAQVQPIAAAVTDYSATLDGIRLRDRRLRSARAVFRSQARVIRTLQAPPADICTQLGAWRDRGYPTAGAPKLDDPALAALFASGDDSAAKKIARAARRLRALGVSRRVVRIFTGDTLYEGIDLGDPELHIGEASR
jgi:hypothetical protein